MIVVWVVVQIDPGAGLPFLYAHKEIPFLAVPRAGEMIEIGRLPFTVDAVSHMPRDRRIAVMVSCFEVSTIDRMRVEGFEPGAPRWSAMWRDPSAAHATGLSSSTATRENATPGPASPDSA